MVNSYLQLYKPEVKIYFKTDYDSLISIMSRLNFKTTTSKTGVIVHGKSWLSNDDQVVIHMYFNSDETYMNSIVIHSVKIFEDDTVEKSFYRKEVILDNVYGKSKYISEFESVRNCEGFIIKHFIKDRFGLEEGIYISID